MMAVRNGNIDVASLLLMHGAEFNGADSSKNTCVHYAAAYGFPECIALLITAGADQNAKNQWNLTPLSVALQKNLFGVVKALLNYSTTDVNCKDDEGRTLVSSSLS
jgi:ankyrin repeat protein